MADKKSMHLGTRDNDNEPAVVQSSYIFPEQVTH